jgi:hypothetical protein
MIAEHQRRRQSNMGEYDRIDQALAGLQVGMNARVDSRIAQEAIAFGAPVMGYAGVDNKCYAAHDDLVTETLTGTFDASDTWTIIVNDISVSVTFASTHTAMITAMVNALNAKAELIALGVVATKVTDQIITLKAKGLDLVVTSSCGGGSSVTTADVTTQWSVFLGVALFSQRGGRDFGAGQGSTFTGAMGTGGTSGYFAGDAVNIMNFGYVWVPVSSSTGNDTAAAYIVYAKGATQGTFSDSSSGTKATGAYFRSTKSTQGLAVLEVRSIA